MLNVYMKPTNFCSVDCEHCYLSKKVRSNPFVISDESLIKVATFIKNLSEKQSDDEKPFIIWHGGEPLMLKPEWFMNAIKILDNVLGKDNYSQAIQTSLIPYNKKWNELIHEKFGSSIGSSIDFSQRTIRGSNQKYLDTWLKKVEIATKDGIYVYPSTVPTKSEMGNAEKIINWFIEHNFSDFNFSRYVDMTDKSENAIRNLDFSHFLIDVLKIIIKKQKNKEKTPTIRIIQSAINGVYNYSPGEQWGTNCQQNTIIVEPNGNLNTCPNRTSHEETFGSAFNQIDDFMLSESRRKWIRYQKFNHIKKQCIECEYRDWCKSACPLIPNDINLLETECSGYKVFLDYVKKQLKSENKDILVKYIS